MTPSPVEMQVGELLFKEGDPSGTLYFIKEGYLMVFQKRGEFEVPLEILKTGDFVGTVSLFFGEQRSASVRALAPTKLDAYPYHDPQKLLAGVPSWIFGVFKDVVTRLKRMDQSITQARQTEKLLQRKLPNRFTYAGMLCRLLKMGIESRAGGEIIQVDFSIHDFPEKAAPVLQMGSDVLRPIFQEIVKSPYLNAVFDSKQELSLQVPSLHHLNKLAEFFEEKSRFRQQGLIYPSKLPYYKALHEMGKEWGPVLKAEKVFSKNLQDRLTEKVDSDFVSKLIDDKIVVTESLADAMMLRIDMEMLHQQISCEEIGEALQKIQLPSPDPIISL